VHFGRAQITSQVFGLLVLYFCTSTPTSPQLPWFLPSWMVHLHLHLQMLPHSHGQQFIIKELAQNPLSLHSQQLLAIFCLYHEHCHANTPGPGSPRTTQRPEEIVRQGLKLPTNSYPSKWSFSLQQDTVFSRHACCQQRLPASSISSQSMCKMFLAGEGSDRCEVELFSRGSSREP
jgi:hypothetical protein